MKRVADNPMEMDCAVGMVPRDPWPPRAEIFGNDALPDLGCIAPSAPAGVAITNYRRRSRAARCVRAVINLARDLWRFAKQPSPWK